MRLLPRRLPLALVRVGRRRPRLWLALSVLAVLLAAFLGSRLRLETDVLSLVPGDNPVVKGFTTTVQRFGSVDTLLAVVRIPDPTDLEPALAYADHLAAELRAWDQIRWVEYRLEDPVRAAAPLVEHAPLLIGPERLDELLATLGDEGALAAHATRLRAQLIAPQGLVTEDLLRLDPLGLLPPVLERLRVGDVGAAYEAESGYLVDPTHTLLLLLVKPDGPAQDVAFDRVLADGLDARLAAAAEAWREEGWEGEPPAVDFTGGYMIALEDSRKITTDVLVGLASSLIGVMILFLVAFRRPAALVYAAWPLLAGLALTFTFIAAAVGRLNSITSAFAALLIGLGIDFIIVLYGRYVEERQAGRAHEEAVDTVGRHTGVGVLLGAVTTAATFYAFLVTDFTGLAELGLMTGTGILLLALAVFLLLPALLSLRPPRLEQGRVLVLHAFGAERLCRLALRRPRAVLALSVTVTVLLAAAAVRLEFNDDMRTMRAGGHAVRVQDEVMERFGLRFTPTMLRLDAANEAEALDKVRELMPLLAPLVEDGQLARIDALTAVLPGAAEQRAALARLAAGDVDPAAARARLAAALAGAGLNPAAFSEGLELLERALAADRPLSLSELEGTSLGHAMERYLARTPEGVSTVIYCYPAAGEWRREAPPVLLDLVAGRDDAVLTGVNVVSAELRRIVWGDAARAAALGLVVVFLMLWADLGTAGRAALALVPLLGGLAWMLGGMALLGIPMNLMNIFVVTMVIGIGVDYGVHLLHRWIETGGDAEAVARTGKAITVAALTTVVGFGSLVLSHFPGLRSVGAAAILGALSCAVLGMTMLPSLLALRRR